MYKRWTIGRCRASSLLPATVCIRRNCGKMYGKIEHGLGALTVSQIDDCQPRVSVRQSIESPNLISFFQLLPQNRNRISLKMNIVAFAARCLVIYRCITATHSAIDQKAVLSFQVVSNLVVQKIAQWTGRTVTIYFQIVFISLLLGTKVLLKFLRTRKKCIITRCCVCRRSETTMIYNNKMTTTITTEQNRVYNIPNTVWNFICVYIRGCRAGAIPLALLSLGKGRRVGRRKQQTKVGSNISLEFSHRRWDGNSRETWEESHIFPTFNVQHPLAYASMCG